MHERIEFGLEENIWYDPLFNKRKKYIVSLLPKVKEWLQEYASSQYHICVKLSNAKLVIYDKSIAVLFKLIWCTAKAKPFRDAEWLEERIRTSSNIEGERIYLNRTVHITTGKIVINNCIFLVDTDIALFLCA